MRACVRACILPGSAGGTVSPPPMDCAGQAILGHFGNSHSAVTAPAHPPSPATPSQAILGYSGVAGAMATACPANSYCEAGTERPMACPSGTTSAELANDLTDCVSAPGYYGPNGKPRATEPAQPLCGRPSDRRPRTQASPASGARSAATAPSPPPLPWYPPPLVAAAEWRAGDSDWPDSETKRRGWVLAG
jgi:hypothetical protein